MTHLIPVHFTRLIPATSYAAIVLGNKEKKFAIYVEPNVGHVLHQFLTDERPRRPHTFNLFTTIMENTKIQLLHVVIYDLNDTVFMARLFLEHTQADARNILAIDARPSDCIILALMRDAPLLCCREVFDRVIPFHE